MTGSPQSPYGSETTSAATAASPGGSEGSATGNAQRVDFYVMESVAPRDRLRTACRVVEKAYLAGHTVLVWHTDLAELREFDELLWTFADGTFVPHEAISPNGFATAPVLLTSGDTPEAGIDVLVNLAPDVPACATGAHRIAEFIDADPERRQAGRSRFRAYKERGLSPATHNLRGD